MKENLLPFNINKNGRIYTKDSYDWSKIKELSDKKTLFGELRHDDDILLFDVNLSNVSHLIKNLEVYDDGVYGEIQVLDTEKGKFLRTLLNDKGDYNISISSRGTGTVENGVVKIDNLNGFDYVYSPETILERRRKKLDRILNRMGK